MTTTQTLTARAEADALAAFTRLMQGPATRELAVASRDAITRLAEVTGLDYDTAREVVGIMYRKASR